MAEKKSLFDKLKRGLFMTHTEIIEKVKESMIPDLPIDQSAIDGLEEGLLGADVGAELTMSLVGRLEQRVRDEKITNMDRLTQVIREETRALIPRREAQTIDVSGAKPFVILVVGVNGTGKTTTIGKLAARFRREGRSVMLAAGDTFRAAAIDQLKIWGERTGSEVVAGAVGADAAGLVFDAVSRARDGGADVLLVDTAGRLQNKEGLMEELAKVIRVMRKVEPTAPHAVLLVLDATTGQNALSQVDVFRDRAGVTGLVMTKLDGTARGGILVAISAKHGLQVHAIGVGEGVDDLQAFDAGDFAEAIASSN